MRFFLPALSANNTTVCISVGWMKSIDILFFILTIHKRFFIDFSKRVLLLCILIFPPSVSLSVSYSLSVSPAHYSDLESNWPFFHIQRHSNKCDVAKVIRCWLASVMDFFLSQLFIIVRIALRLTKKWKSQMIFKRKKNASSKVGQSLVFSNIHSHLMRLYNVAIINHTLFIFIFIISRFSLAFHSLSLTHSHDLNSILNHEQHWTSYGWI